MFMRIVRTSLIIAIIIFAILSLANFWKYSQQTNLALEKITLNNIDFKIIEASGLSARDAYVWKANAINLNDIPSSTIFRIHTKNLNYASHDIIRISGIANMTPISNLYNIYYPKITIIGHQDNDYFYNLRQSQANKINHIFTPPAANFINGLVFGGYNNSSKYFQNNLRILGLNHILAVSGFNLTLIILLLRKIFPLRAKKPRFLILMFAIWFFVLLVGGSSSIFRAGLFLSILLGLDYLGLKPKPITILSLLVLIYATFYPSTIFYDIGWQLSYLAFFGILLFDKVTIKHDASKLNKAIILSLGAYLFTLPVILIHFHQTSLIGMAMTVLIEPIILPLMLLGIFLIGVGNFIDIDILKRSFVFIDQAINWILAKINWVAQNLKAMELKVENFNLEKLLIVAVVILSFVIIIKKFQSFKGLSPVFFSFLIIFYTYFIYFPMPSKFLFLEDKNFQVMINPDFEAGYLDLVGFHFSKVKPTIVIFSSKSFDLQSSLKVIAKDYNIQAVLAPGFHYAINSLDTTEKIFNVENFEVWDLQYNLPYQKSSYYLSIGENYQINFGGSCYQLNGDKFLQC